MKKISGPLSVATGVVFFIAAAIIIVPNPVGFYLNGEAKANGYISYTPSEAYALAKRICTQCHGDERIKHYCERCGPPFIAVVPHMQTFIANYRVSKPGLKVESITPHQAAAIVQVWNALLGNWEGDFREQDILKLLGDNDLLVALYKTPVKDRYLESALMGRDDLKVGYMAEMKKALKDGKNDGMEGHDHGAGGGHQHDGH